MLRIFYIIILLAISSAAFSQNDIDDIPLQGWTDIFSVADKVLEIREDRKYDPLRAARAQIKISKASKRKMKVILEVQSRFDKGEITYSAYVHLMASVLQITVTEYLDMQMTISAHGLHYENQRKKNE